MNSKKTGATTSLGRYKALPPIGYKGPFKGMEEIYKDYRNTLMNKGLYRAYFNSRISYGDSPRKFTKMYSPERQSKVSEGEGKEQHTETNANKNIETKNEINKQELSQKTEDSQKIETTKENETSQKIEKQNELSYEKIGLPYSYETRQTDITPNKRPSPYGDRIESRW